MASFWRVVRDVVQRSDIILIVADARIPESVHPELLKKIKSLKKKYVIVYNKKDLLDTAQKKILNELLKKDIFSCAVSATHHSRTMVLLRKLNGIARGKPSVIGVVGYPNTGKSSLINALKGKSSAPVGSQAGVTRGVQLLRISRTITLLDSPGVIPADERQNIFLQSKIAAKSPNQIRDIEGVAMKLIVELAGNIESFYAVPPGDPDDVLEAIAEKLCLKKKGNVPDTKRAAERIMYDWQKGTLTSTKR